MDSPFSHLFGRNEAPSAADIPVVHGMLSEPLEKLGQLDSEIAHLEAVLANLRQERDDVQKYVDAHQRLLSPSLRIPSEILSEIFVRCLPEDRNPVCSASQAPLLLGLICRSWREVCLSTPRLWTSIHVVLPTSGEITRMCRTVDEKRLGVEAWLDRSGSLPLSFSIFGSCQLSISSRHADAEQRRIDLEQNAKTLSQHVDQLLRCFTKQTYRWQNVELRLNKYCAKTLEESMAALADPDWSVASLNSFAFMLLDSMRPPGQDLTYLPKFLAAPHLRRVTVAVNIQDVLQHLEQSNPNLSQLNVSCGGVFLPGLQLPSFFSLLSRYAHLRDCHLDVQVPQTVSLESYPDISLPLLRKLSLNFNGEREVSDIDQLLFNKISVPALHSLTLTVSRAWHVIFAHAPFLSWLIDNQIHELNLSLPLSIEAYLECLTLVPNLSRLAIHDRVLTKESAETLIDRLLPSSERPEPLCPTLQQLSIFGLEVDDELMLNLARSRRSSIFEGINSLDILRVRFERYKQLVGIDNMLDELRKQGMEINFEYQLGRKDEASLGQHQVTGPFENSSMSSAYMMYT
ncbi:hypothetical protein VKT23_018194 [Stygiomarasmius scandens]|uniref:F-box domain-containing protein n=1 Tax=Marasmiellus scandens TaxID=2682957 RepID=A0ABR1ITR2_9AGAR